MRLTRCAPALLAAVSARALSIPAPGNLAITKDLAHDTKKDMDSFTVLTWSELDAIMSGDSDTGKNSGSHGDSDNDRVGLLDGPAATPCENPKVRVEWDRLKESKKEEFLKAVRCLMNKKEPFDGVPELPSIWHTLAWVHNEGKALIHGTDQFLPWHRYYIYMLETLLKDQCSYGGPIPWWYEPDYAGDLADASLFSPEYFGTLHPKINGRTTCVTDGWFANTTVIVGTSKTCLSRGEDKAYSNLVTTNYEERCHGDKNTSYESHRSCVEGTIHAATHNAIGGAMASLSASPHDPIFFLHHGYVDWQWARWQNVDSDRKRTISGCAVPRDELTRVCNEYLTLDTVLKGYGVIPDMKVRDVLDTKNQIMCYTYDKA